MTTRVGGGPGVPGTPVAGNGRADAGSAVVEFVALGMLLLLPLVYLVVALSRIQAASYAVDGSARAAARAFTTAGTVEDGTVRAAAAVRIGLQDQAFDVDPAGVMTLTCSAAPCLTPQARVEVVVAVEVVLPGVPAFLDAAVPAHVTVSSRHTETVDRFRLTAPSP